ncbi:hypothetical protein [Komagataeibacter rhaeticus]|uniref:hypothetical protein n=1 Tax=Komagataeibacter rhaeticus TaxID=215221 RepID=UPI00168A9870|nr:hypothetical protein [Komagataeibacter rhaeticus]QOC48333.1 hypothetical protein ICJ78_01570 [Komagataeibacter rhaeticus]
MSYRRCFVLVDWWSQVRSHFLRNKTASRGENSEIALRHIEEIIEEKLKIEAHQPTQWEVSFRLYAGWMRGGTPTAVLIDYEAMYAGYASRRRRGNCLKNLIFLPSSIGMRRGDRLISEPESESGLIDFSQNSADTNWGIFNQHIWGDYNQHSQEPLL